MKTHFQLAMTLGSRVRLMDDGLCGKSYRQGSDIQRGQVLRIEDRSWIIDEGPVLVCTMCVCKYL